MADHEEVRHELWRTLWAALAAEPSLAGWNARWKLCGAIEQATSDWLRSDETREAIAEALHDAWAKELVGSPPAWLDCSVTWRDYQRGHADAVVRVLTGEAGRG